MARERRKQSSSSGVFAVVLVLVIAGIMGGVIYVNSQKEAGIEQTDERARADKAWEEKMKAEAAAKPKDTPAAQPQPAAPQPKPAVQPVPTPAPTPKPQPVSKLAPAPVASVPGYEPVEVKTTLGEDPVASGKPFPKGPRPSKYSWQKPHAEVLSTGNFKWKPKPFVFEKGDSVRYIDFEGGNDTKSGTSKDQAWKHHPWDKNAQANAKACKGIHTYVFKGGVVYRGWLKAPESGAPGNPIRLTSDPSWGNGKPALYGSTQIKGGWKKASEAEAPGIGKPDMAWYIDVGKGYDKDRDKGMERSYHAKFSDMWQVKGDDVTRLHMARWPDYDLSDPYNPVKNWPVWDSYDNRSKELRSPKLKNLGGSDLLNGGILWSETSFLMGAASMHSIKGYNPSTGGIKSSMRYELGRIRSKRTHFMIENVDKFLDAPGEYFFANTGPKAGRLYLIPPEGTDPNNAVYEVAQDRILVWIADQNNIVVSGLNFHFNDTSDGQYDWPREVGASPCVRIIGNCNNITVKNCGFYNVANAVVAFPRPTGEGGPYGVYRKEIGDFQNDVMDNIFVTDNEVEHASMHGTIYIVGSSSKGGKPHGKLKNVKVMRNRTYDTGFRHGRFWTSNIPAISVTQTETLEIAGNIVDTSFGCGIFTLGGKGSGSTNDVPLNRMLVHDNMIDNTMLGANDYGGLEHFQGGPYYVYNNVTRNCVGNRTLGRELGYTLYLDGGFKCYSFNNIIAGNVKENDPNYYNHCGYFMVFGFMDQLFNNTIYHFEKALDGSSGNRSNILGNLMLESQKTFIGQNRAGDVSMVFGGDTGEMGRSGIPTMAYAWNVFFGKTNGKDDGFGYVGGSKGRSGGKAPVHKGSTLEELKEKLEKENIRVASLGWHVDENPIKDGKGKDYRPSPNSPAKERGVKYFVPWSLYGMVGEWNFYKHPTAPAVVLGEGYYMTEEYRGRDMYYHIPRMDLIINACMPEDYVQGPLEDWIEGALTFDGKHRYAVLSNSEIRQDKRYSGKGGGFSYKGSDRKSVDMDTNNFLIELYFKTGKGHTGGVLVCKEAGTGYILGITDDGAVRLNLKKGGSEVCSRESSVKVNDGEWHHVIAEADRSSAEGITIYVDGKAANGVWSGTMPKDSLSNAGDFIVGRANKGGYFQGLVDFLRVCRGTLADAKTDIDELYEWEFNGPHLRDFMGNAVTGSRRDAGALELTE